MSGKGENVVKRILLASGLVFALVPPVYALNSINPDVRLSGTFGLGLSYLHDKNNAATIEDWNIENNASNFRIEAASSEVGLRAFMAYERGASNDHTGVEDVREFFGGVSSHYGTLLYGRKATDYRIAGERIDPFYNTSVAGFNGQFASEGASYGLSNLTNGFTSNTIAYHSPTFLGGFSLNGAGYINDNNNQGSGDKADGALGVGYANSNWLGLDASLQYLDLNGNVVTGAPAAQSNAGRLSVSLGQKLWAAGASFEYIDVAGESAPREYGYLSGTYQLLQSLRLAASYGHVSHSLNASSDGNGGTLGAFYDLMHNFSIYGAVRHVALKNSVQDRATTVAAGVKFVFNVDL